MANTYYAGPPGAHMLIMDEVLGVTMAAKRPYKVHVVDEDGDEYESEIGGVDFTEACFTSEGEAIHEFEAALGRKEYVEECFPPVKATVVKCLWTTKIETKEVTTKKLVNKRPY